MSEKLLGQPLPRDVCQLLVDVASMRTPQWVEIRIDERERAIYSYEDTPFLDGTAWECPDCLFRLISYMPKNGVDFSVWGIRRADWEAMLAEIAGQ